MSPRPNPHFWRVHFLLFFLTLMSLSSLGCKALCIVLNYLVLKSICLISSLVYFKNGLNDLTRSGGCLSVHAFNEISPTALRFAKFTRFYDTPFSYFFFHLWWWLLFIFPSTCNFPSLQEFCCFPDLLVLLFSLFLFAHFPLSACHILMSDSIQISLLYILIVWLRVNTLISITWF